MNRRTVFSVAIAALVARSWVAEAAAARGRIWYVKQPGGASGDGTTWAKAFQSLQQALAAASKGDEIWIARGAPDVSDATKSRSQGGCGL
jgi:hypothetical protein